MKVSTANNSLARFHSPEILSAIGEAQKFSGEQALTYVQRHFCATIKTRLKADVDYLAKKLRLRELLVWVFEPFDTRKGCSLGALRRYIKSLSSLRRVNRRIRNESLLR